MFLYQKRKEKKRLEKEKDQETVMNGASADNRTEQNGGVRSSDEGEGIDPNAAFVKKSKKKMPEQNSIPKIETRGDTSAASSERSNSDVSIGHMYCCSFKLLTIYILE